ncbi:MAG: 6-hydroxymethylpterin diphosphokinase MptE-like protein [Ignavibacteriaceae bacterium]
MFNNNKFSNYSLTRVVRGIKNRIMDIPESLTWIIQTELSKSNKKKLESFRDCNKGKRCFIVANGPSLKYTELSFLQNEITIGMNRIYLLNNKINFVPSYLVVADVQIQLLQFQKEYNELSLVKFFPWEVRNKFTHTENMLFYKMKYKTDFSPDFTKFIGAGKSVTVVCIQLAYFMGFSEVYLIGKDHSYSHNSSDVPGTRIISNGSESNHFIDGYYKSGMKWSLPNYLEEEISYRLARIEYEKAGRKILDATVNGKLTVFEKVDFYSLFEKR